LISESIAEAARILAKSKFSIALTGAGISADSGIPTFRGRGGLWSRYRAEELATPEAFARNPVLVWEWYKWRMEIVFNAKPNPGHYALAELEKLGVLKCVITQNVDGLHQLAGSKNVIEMHGSIRRVRCVSCGYREILREPPKSIPPLCPRCGSLLRPDVVWFGEPIPREALEKAFRLAEEADVILVVGTSGKVMPAALIPHVVKSRGGLVIEVNVEESDITPIADIFIRSRASEALPKLVNEVKRLLGMGQ